MFLERHDRTYSPLLISITEKGSIPRRLQGWAMTAAFTVCEESLSMMTWGKWMSVSAVSHLRRGDYREEFHRVLTGQK